MNNIIWKGVFYLFLVIDKKFLLGLSSVIASVFLIVFAAMGYEEAVPTLSSAPRAVVIDAGHGGMDGGSVSESGVLEKKLNLEIAQKLQKIFADNGYKVIMTRETDESLSENDGSIRSQKTSDLKQRAKIANESQAGLFLSIHINKYESPEVFGAQTFYSKNDETGKQYAESIMESFRTLDPGNKRLAKIHPNKNLVFQNLKIPGVLIECGFISNSEDLNNLQNSEYQQKIAEAIYNGITNLTN